MTKKYDLHCHSTASDGVLTPTELVQRAHEQGVNVLALCDHDTVMGIDEAKLEADKLGIELINGVEISTNWEGRGIHIVGLNFDCIQPLNMRNIKTNRDWAGIFGNKRDEYR